MLSYTTLSNYFGTPLADASFQAFLRANFDDLSEYNVTESDYIISEKAGIDLGFTNQEAVFDEDDNIVFEQGNPVFSHFNINPGSKIKELPFAVSFTDIRDE